MFQKGHVAPLLDLEGVLDSYKTLSDKIRKTQEVFWESSNSFVFEFGMACAVYDSSKRKEKLNAFRDYIFPNAMSRKNTCPLGFAL